MGWETHSNHYCLGNGISLENYTCFFFPEYESTLLSSKWKIGFDFVAIFTIVYEKQQDGKPRMHYLVLRKHASLDRYLSVGV